MPNKPSHHHHLVPQFWLRNFSVDGEVETTTIGDESIQRRPPKSIMARKHFYSDKSKDVSDEVEKFLQTFEGPASSVFRTVISSQQVPGPEGASAIARFAMAQWARTKRGRQLILEQVEAASDPAVPESMNLAGVSDPFVRRIHLELIKTRIFQLTEMLDDWVWFVRVSSDDGLILSDNPVVPFVHRAGRALPMWRYPGIADGLSIPLSAHVEILVTPKPEKILGAEYPQGATLDLAPGGSQAIRWLQWMNAEERVVWDPNYAPGDQEWWKGMRKERARLELKGFFEIK